MFKEYRILRNLRRFLAVEAGRTAIGEVVRHTIENRFLKQIKRDLKNESDAGRRAEIQEKLDLWEMYADRGSDQGRSWTKAALKIVVAIGRKVGLTNDQQLELVSDVTSEFYNPKRSVIKGIYDYDYNDGVDKLMGLWNLKVRGVTLSLLRASKKQRQNEMAIPTDSSGQEFDFPDRNKTQPGHELDGRHFKKIVEDMGKWVKGKIPKDMVLLYDLMEANDYYKVTNEMKNTWSESTGNAKSQFYNRRKDVQRLMAEYFEEVLNISMDKRKMKKLKLANRVADNFWRTQVASWVLEIYNARRDFIASL